MEVFVHVRRAAEALAAGAREARRTWTESSVRERAAWRATRLNAIVLSLNERLVEAKKAVAVAIADHKRLVAQRDQEDAAAAEWDARARKAAEASHAELAAEAAERRRAHEGLARTLAATAEEHGRALCDLKKELHILLDRIDEAKRRKNAVLARDVLAASAAAVERIARAVEQAERATREIDRA